MKLWICEYTDETGQEKTGLLNSVYLVCFKLSRGYSTASLDARTEGSSNAVPAGQTVYACQMGFAVLDSGLQRHSRLSTEDRYLSTYLPTMAGMSVYDTVPGSYIDQPTLPYSPHHHLIQQPTPAHSTSILRVFSLIPTSRPPAYLRLGNHSSTYLPTHLPTAAHPTWLQSTAM